MNTLLQPCQQFKHVDGRELGIPIYALLIDNRYDVSQPVEMYTKEMARTLESMKSKKLGVIHAPLVEIELDHVNLYA